MARRAVATGSGSTARFKVGAKVRHSLGSPVGIIVEASPPYLGCANPCVHCDERHERRREGWTYTIRIAAKGNETFSTIRGLVEEELNGV